VPPQDWSPDPSWPPAPPDWKFFVETTSSQSAFDLLVDPNSPTPSRPWYRKKRYVIPLGFVILVGVVSAIPDKTPSRSLTVADGTPTAPPTSSPVMTHAKRSAESKTKAKAAADKKVKAAAPASSTRTHTHAVVVKPKPTPKKTSSSRKCDPNYGGACVPIASDVDCAGGSGNGPAYFSGVAKVIGTDIYDLDRDHDGYACEPN